MHKLIIVGFSVLILACKSDQKSIESDKFTVTYNENVETYFLAEILAIKHRTINKQFEDYKLNTCKGYLPIVTKALNKYKNLTDDPVAIKTAQLNDSLIKNGYGNDMMMRVLLQQPNFKLSKAPKDFKFSNTPLTGDKRLQMERMISDYLKALYEFYQSKSLGEFFEENTSFYLGAANEVKKHIPGGFTKAMETYYGDSRAQYIVLVSPMMVWPIVDKEGRGISATVDNNNEKTVYEIMSPYVQVPIKANDKDYDQFGFDYQLRARSLTIHEFCHSFVNSELEPYEKDMGMSSHLFTDKLRIIMANKGVQTWDMYIIESLIRMGEVRIALIQNDSTRANYLRNYHTNIEGFVFIPLLEEKIKIYENNRDKYPMWKDFIPELLSVFEYSSGEFIDMKLKEAAHNNKQ